MTLGVRRLMNGAATLIVATGIAFVGLSADPAVVFAKGTKNDHSPNVESTKKPGQDCEQLKKDLDEYKECVKARAQENKHDKGKGKGTGKGKGKGEDNDQ